MNLSGLVAIYLVVGLACAVAVYRSSPSGGRSAALSAVVTVPLWPLWAPFALIPNRPQTPPDGDGPEARIERALFGALRTISNSAIAAELSRDDADKIIDEARRCASRLREIEVHIATHHNEAARRPMARLEDVGVDAPTRARALLHVGSIERLKQLRETEARALDELVELVELLRTQLVLARFDASGSESIVDLKHELWARVGGEADGYGAAEAEADGGGGP